MCQNVQKQTESGFYGEMGQTGSEDSGFRHSLSVDIGLSSLTGLQDNCCLETDSNIRLQLLIDHKACGAM